MNLERLQGLGASVASIGHAGTFDGIFLTGVLAVLIASLTSGPDRSRGRQARVTQASHSVTFCVRISGASRSVGNMQFVRMMLGAQFAMQEGSARALRANQRVPTSQPACKMTSPLPQRSVSDGRSYGRLGFWLFGVLALLAVILVVLRIGELERFAALARQAKPEWLLLALALQCLTYVCAALVWHTALVREGMPHRLRSLIPLGIAKLFTDQVLPSGGISGTLLVMRGLERRKVPTPRAMGVLLVGVVSFYTAYGLAALVGLVVLQLHHTLGRSR